MQPPYNSITFEQGIISPQREADHYAKATGRTKYINEHFEWGSYISMGNSCNYCEQYTRASSGV